MHKNTPEHAHACPLFAEWKLTDAANEFKTTLGLSETKPITQFPIPDALTDTIITRRRKIRYLSLTISGWHRTRLGCRFFFGISVTAPYPPLAAMPEETIHLPITQPRGYLATLQKMHRHGMPLTRSQSLIGKALATTFDRKNHRKNHRCRPLFLTTDATRITLPEGDTYDLPLGRRLSPNEATSEVILRQSHAAYRIARGYECTKSSPTTTPQTFLTADLHLGHQHAIRYYCRPFLSDDTDTMDSVLIDNWNHTVGPKDSVIFAGDFTYKADRDTTDAYRSRLNGTVTWIQGNHDTCLDNTEPSRTITADGRDLLIIHNPKHVPDSYDGWVIHAHTHNARLETHPFISFTHKTVNISTDVTGYRPVPLTEVCALISAGETAGRTAPIIIREMPATTDITR